VIITAGYGNRYRHYVLSDFGMSNNA